MTKNIDDQWREWIRHNVSRGCSKQELLDILVREGFEREAAFRALTPVKAGTKAIITKWFRQPRNSPPAD